MLLKIMSLNIGRSGLWGNSLPVITPVLISWLILGTGQIAQAQIQRITDPALLRAGQKLYQENCAECHGKNAEGPAGDWHVADKEGKFPPPPLNGTAHAWHHPLKGLAHTIRNGTTAIGGNMPAWKDKLSDDDIFAIVMWLSSLWPDEIYEAWMQRNVE